MHRPTPHPLAVAIFAGLLQLPAQAALYAVDTGPYTLPTGKFAAWYQDSHGRVLDLCLSKAVSSRVAGAPGAPSYMCTLLPTPGVFDDTQPIVFPSNFPDEAFWFTADAAIVILTGRCRSLQRRKVLAVVADATGDGETSGAGAVSGGRDSRECFRISGPLSTIRFR